MGCGVMECVVLVVGRGVVECGFGGRLWIWWWGVALYVCCEVVCFVEVKVRDISSVWCGGNC